MKSKAHFKSHPIHPILVAFPIAFFTGGFAMDVISFFNESAGLKMLVSYMLLGGLIMGLAAAVPGLIDFMYTVPPHSSAKKRAIKHAMLNLTMLGVFGTAYWLRSAGTGGRLTILVLEFSGVILLSISGFLGGTLVYRNQIGVDIRYAGAGKWNETNGTEIDGKVEAGKSGELKINQMKLIKINGKRLVLAKTEEGYVAFTDRCTHRGGSLAGGAMICNTVQCPWHGSQFDVRTGAVKAGPAGKSIDTYNVQEEDGTLFIVL